MLPAVTSKRLLMIWFFKNIYFIKVTGSAQNHVPDTPSAPPKSCFVMLIGNMSSRRFPRHSITPYEVLVLDISSINFRNCSKYYEKIRGSAKSS